MTLGDTQKKIISNVNTSLMIHVSVNLVCLSFLSQTDYQRVNETHETQFESLLVMSYWVEIFIFFVENAEWFIFVCIEIKKRNMNAVFAALKIENLESIRTICRCGRQTRVFSKILFTLNQLANRFSEMTKRTSMVSQLFRCAKRAINILYTQFFFEKYLLQLVCETNLLR